MNAIIQPKPKLEYGFISCPNCNKAVLLYQNRAWQCAVCGHGSFFPIDEKRHKIVWLPKDEAEWKVGFNRFLKVDIDGYLKRPIRETS